jgi:ATP-dependent exoDNAse (exonuclease V) beta subunit
MTINPDKINPQHYEAAVRLAGRDALVTANAGSGKTHLLVDRYFHLLSSGVHPRSMIAFTFTEKTARQLKEKILYTLPQHPEFAALPKNNLREWRVQIHEAPIGTIHQFCLRVLQEGEMDGGPFRGTIIDPATEINLRESILNQILKESFESGSAETETLLPIYGMPALRDALRSIVVKSDLSPQGEAEFPPLPEMEEDERHLLEAFLGLAEKIKSQVAQAKHRHHWLSFDDLELRALENIKHPNSALQKFLSPLQHLLIDEFQDTSPIQIQLMEALKDFKAQKKRPLFIFAVGDPKQSIYRFRNVDRRLIERTEDKILKSGGQAFVLPKNYRSLPDLVAFTNRFSASAFPKAVPSEALRPSGITPVLRVVPVEETEDACDRLGRHLAEARWMAGKIKSHHDSGHPWESMAVLFRASASALPLIDQLKAHSIPFTLRGGRSLFDRQEIIDLKNLLYFLVKPRENLRLIGLLRSPLFLLSDAALFFLLRETKKEQSLYEYLLQSHKTELPFPETLNTTLPGERQKILWAVGLLQDWINQATLLSPHALLTDVVHRLNLRRLYGEIGGDWEAPLAIEQFLTWLKQMESEMDGPDLTSVVALLKQLDRTPTQMPPLGDVIEGGGGVHLLTIHAAKGLQFPTVFLLDLARSSPTFRDPVQYQRGEWSLKVPDPEGETRETARFQAMKELHLREEAEENKRLLYVALTRAQDELWIPLHSAAAAKNSLEAVLRAHIPDDFLQKYHEREPSVPFTAIRTSGLENKSPMTFESTGHMSGIEGLPTLTVSQLETFFHCPVKYHFSYRRGLSDETWEEQSRPSQTLLGTLLHRGLHHLQIFPDKTPEQIIQFLLQTEPLWEQESMVADLASYLDHYLKSPTFEKISRAQEDLSELPFVLKLKNGYVRGQLDRLVRCDGRWYLIDFKFSKKKINLKQLDKDYGFQLKTYALASKRFLRGVPPTVEVHLLGSAQALAMEFSDQDLIAHQSVLEEIIGQFQSSPLEEVQLREYCYACPFNRKIPLCPVPAGGMFRP